MNGKEKKKSNYVMTWSLYYKGYIGSLRKILISVLKKKVELRWLDPYIIKVRRQLKENLKFSPEKKVELRCNLIFIL